MGYPAKKRQPALTAASATASQPFISTLAISFYLLKDLNCSVGAHGCADSAGSASVIVGQIRDKIALWSSFALHFQDLFRAECYAELAALAQIRIDLDFHLLSSNSQNRFEGFGSFA